MFDDLTDRWYRRSEASRALANYRLLRFLGSSDRWRLALERLTEAFTEAAAAIGRTLLPAFRRIVKAVADLSAALGTVKA